MRMSDIFAPTLKEDPAEAEVISHKLMLRAGMIRKTAAGVYSFLPLGRRSLNKVMNIIREELDKAGAQELLLPVLSPSELWQESGRWYAYGREMMRLKDRHDRDFALGPTHEEVITDLVRREIHSYKDLPVNLYQIQVKFRDEQRPRFGLLRGREFIMKDAYSFHVDEESMKRTYEDMFDAYTKILNRINVEFRSVIAPTGLIGGDMSHEFMILADSGEDHLIFCTKCDYAANREIALRQGPADSDPDIGLKQLEKIETPGKKSVEDVSACLKVDPTRVIKTLIYKVPNVDETDSSKVAAQGVQASDDLGQLYAFLIRGDRELSDDKAMKITGTDLVMITPEDFKTKELSFGYVGPSGLDPNIKIIADPEVSVLKNMVIGANLDNNHFINANIDRDFRIDEIADVTFARAGDMCHLCAGELTERKGIEAGQVFQLGTKYSEKMNASYLDENGEEKVMVMGCYGIGVSRILAATIEQLNDDKGIKWPTSIAPYEVVVLALNNEIEAVQNAAHEIYETLKTAKVEAVIDDRAVSPGVKFSEADLIGFPYQVIVGRKGVEKGQVEIKVRHSGDKEELEIEKAAARIADLVRADLS